MHRYFPLLHNRVAVLFIGVALLFVAYQVPAQAPEQIPDLAGNWVINDSLSDNTDRQVEAALRAAGERVQRRLFGSKQRYRGGPPEHELYDRISYDRILHIALQEPAYRFTYADDFNRVAYTDNRSRSVSLTGLAEIEDFSLAHWEGDTLVIEAHVRDGGFTEERYTLIENGLRLRARFTIKPRSFQVPIELERIYERPAP